MSKNKKTKRKKKQEVQKAGMGGIVGGVALASAGTMVYDEATGQDFAQFETADGHVIGIWADTDNNGIYDTEFTRATPIPEDEQEQIEAVVQAETVPVSEEGQSFSEAFADARNEVGAGGVFEWNGQQYNTFYAEEWQDMDETQHNEWASLPTDEKIDYYADMEDNDLNDVDNSVDDNDNIDDEITNDDNLIAEEQMDDDLDNDMDDIDNDDAGEWEIV